MITDLIWIIHSPTITNSWFTIASSIKLQIYSLRHLFKITRKSMMQYLIITLGGDIWFLEIKVWKCFSTYIFFFELEDKSKKEEEGKICKTVEYHFCLFGSLTPTPFFSFECYNSVIQVFFVFMLFILLKMIEDPKELFLVWVITK